MGAWDSPPTDAEKIDPWAAPPADSERVQAPVVAPQVGPGETYVNRALDSALMGLPSKAVDLISTGILHQGGGVKLTRQAKDTLKAAGEPLPPEAPGLVDTYRQVRDNRALRTAAGSDQNPWTAALGSATGIGLSLAAPGPKITFGTGPLGAIVSNAATAGAYGTTGALVNGRADLTKGQVVQALKDVAGVDAFKRAAQDFSAGNYGHSALDVMGAGGPGAALTGGVLGGATELAGPLVRKAAAPVADLLESKGISMGRRVLNNGTDLNASTKVPLSDESVMAANNAGAFRFGGSTQGALDRLEGATSAQAAKYADIVDRLEKAGIEGPHAHSLAMQLAKEAKDVYLNTADQGLADLYRNQGLALEEVAGPEGRLGLTQAENIKRHLQDKSNYSIINTKAANNAKKAIASTLRQSIENTIDNQLSAGWNPTVGKIPQDVQDLGAQFVPVKRELGNLIGARDAAERGVMRGAKRSAVGPMEIGAGLAEMAAGHPSLAVPATIGMKLLRSRGPSTAAAMSFGGADLLRNLPALNPGSVGRSAAFLGQGLQTPVPPQSDEEIRNQMLIAALRGQGGQP